MRPDWIQAYNRNRFAGPRPRLCYSPSNNLYFGIDGNVVSCCQNRQQALGRYPEQSIREIWEGAQRQELQDFIERDDLSGGCTACASHMKAGNFGAVVAQKFDAYSIKEGYPTSMEFELHNICNLECVMCCGELSSSIRHSRERLPPQPTRYDAAFIEQLREFVPHLEMTTFFGGEPFLIKLYHRIWDVIIDLNPACKIMVQTNGTVRNPIVEGYLERGNFQLGISLDSIRKATYEGIRVNAKFEKVMDNVRFFVDYCQRKHSPVTFAMCVVPRNWEEVPDYVAHANDLGALVYMNTVWSPKEQSLWFSGAHALRRAYEHCETGLFSPRTPSEHFNLRALKGLISLLTAWHDFIAFLEEHGFDHSSAAADAAAFRRRLTKKTDGDPRFRERMETLNPFPGDFGRLTQATSCFGAVDGTVRAGTRPGPLPLAGGQSDSSRAGPTRRSLSARR